MFIFAIVTFAILNPKKLINVYVMNIVRWKKKRAQRMAERVKFFMNSFKSQNHKLCIHTEHRYVWTKSLVLFALQDFWRKAIQVAREKLRAVTFSNLTWLPYFTFLGSKQSIVLVKSSHVGEILKILSQNKNVTAMKAYEHFPTNVINWINSRLRAFQELRDTSVPIYQRAL